MSHKNHATMLGMMPLYIGIGHWPQALSLIIRSPSLIGAVNTLD